VPLPFLFLFPGLLLVRRSFPFVFGALCAPVWVFWLLAFRSPPPEASPLRAPIASFSHRHLPQRCSSQISPEPSPVDLSAFCFMFSLVSLYFVSFVLFFVFDFLSYFVFTGFPCICFIISLYCSSLFVLCVFWFLQFCRSSPRLFCHTLSTAGPFFAPPLRQASNTSFSVWGLLAHDRFYFPVFLLFFACNKSCVDRPAFGCDAWSRSLGCGCKHYPSFQVKEDKCWHGVLNSQCQRISVGLGFSALSVKE
jgi:hypothetical protein